MKQLSPAFIEELCRGTDIVEIIGEDTLLKPKGSDNYMGLCPFPSHVEKTPSFSVSHGKQVYYCFGCQQSGNILNYLQNRRGLSFPEAIRYLARRGGIAIPQGASYNKQPKTNDHQKAFDINRKALNFFKENLRTLKETHAAKVFLKNRGLFSLVKEFGLSYGGETWEGLSEHLRRQNCDMKLATALGLVKEKSGRRFDGFRKRLMFPIFSKDGGNVIGFGGRALDDHEPKYLNSGESDYFHKGQVFYGWQKSFPHVRALRSAYIVEGYTDFLSVYALGGVKNVLATLGTAMTGYQAKILSQNGKEVVFLFDGDRAGWEAVKRNLKVLLPFGVYPKVVQLPEWADPDSYIRKSGAENFRKFLTESAKDLLLQVFFEELEAHKTALDRFSVIEKMVPILSLIKDKEIKEEYQAHVVGAFGMSDSRAKDMLNRLSRNTKPGFSSVRESGTYQNLKPVRDGEKEQMETLFSEKKKLISLPLRQTPPAELYLLILSLYSLDYYKQVTALCSKERLSHPLIYHIFEVFGENQGDREENYKTLRQSLFYELKDGSALNMEVHPVLKALASDEQKMNFIKDCVNKVDEGWRLKKIKQIKTSLSSDQKNAHKYLEQIKKLNQSFLENK